MGDVSCWTTGETELGLIKPPILDVDLHIFAFMIGLEATSRSKRGSCGTCVDSWELFNQQLHFKLGSTDKTNDWESTRTLV